MMLSWVYSGAGFSNSAAHYAASNKARALLVISSDGEILVALNLENLIRVAQRGEIVLELVK